MQPWPVIRCHRGNNITCLGAWVAPYLPTRPHARVPSPVQALVKQGHRRASCRRVGAAGRLALLVPSPDTRPRHKHTARTRTANKTSTSPSLTTPTRGRAENQQLLKYSTNFFYLAVWAAHALQPHGLTGSHLCGQPFVPAATNKSMQRRILIINKQVLTE